ncbi:biotin transporter BioY [Paracoccus caeni]|uniref:Biotin transporter n=1 Tax=Paracoccus caeni TaxID=657651 RepID=A0A934VZC0_9RHOB|nr:biotin transporter BioY [Paracoccus caeni]MBK4215133.1 biotin transporter BioY [Paracoccus caeni]
MTTLTNAAYGPLDLQNRPLALQVAAVLLGTVLLTLSSQIAVPMVPVPITMQTYAVTLIGALYGWRLGGVTLLVWLAEGAAGLPVFSMGRSGLETFIGPSGGYLVAFPLAAALSGWLVERGWNGSRLVLAFAAMLAGNVLCLIIGAAWLATLVGAKAAIVQGVLPFIVGAVLKSGLAAMTLRLVGRRRARQV